MGIIRPAGWEEGTRYNAFRNPMKEEMHMYPGDVVCCSLPVINSEQWNDYSESVPIQLFRMQRVSL